MRPSSAGRDECVCPQKQEAAANLADAVSPSFHPANEYDLCGRVRSGRAERGGGVKEKRRGERGGGPGHVVA